MYNIIDPTNNQRHSIFSKKGKSLLKYYIKLLIGGSKLLDEIQNKYPKLKAQHIFKYRESEDIIKTNKTEEDTIVLTDEAKEIEQIFTDYINDPENCCKDIVKIEKDKKDKKEELIHKEEPKYFKRLDKCFNWNNGIKPFLSSNKYRKWKECRKKYPLEIKKKKPVEHWNNYL